MSSEGMSEVPKPTAESGAIPVEVMADKPAGPTAEEARAFDVEQATVSGQISAMDQKKLYAVHANLGLSEGLYRTKAENGPMGVLLKKLSLFGVNRGIAGDVNPLSPAEEDMINVVSGMSPEAQAMYAEELIAGVGEKGAPVAREVETFEKYFGSTPFVERLKQG
jgi:hypothetical protein